MRIGLILGGVLHTSFVFVSLVYSMQEPSILKVKTSDGKVHELSLSEINQSNVLSNILHDCLTPASDEDYLPISLGNEDFLRIRNLIRTSLVTNHSYSLLKKSLSHYQLPHIIQACLSQDYLDLNPNLLIKKSIYAMLKHTIKDIILNNPQEISSALKALEILPDYIQKQAPKPSSFLQFIMTKFLQDPRSYTIEKTFTDIRHITLNDQGTHLAISNDALITIMDAYTYTISCTIATSRHGFLRFSPDGSLLATAPDSKATHKRFITIYETSTGKVKTTISMLDLLHDIRFHSNNEYLITSGSTRVSYLHLEKDKRKHFSCISWASVLDSENNQAFISSQKGILQLMLDDSAQSFTSLWGNEPGNFHYRAIALSPNKKLLAITSNQQLLILNLKTNKKTEIPLKNYINFLDFDSTNNFLAVAHDQNTSIWDIRQVKCIATLPRCSKFLFFPDGSRFIKDSQIVRLPIDFNFLTECNNITIPQMMLLFSSIALLNPQKRYTLTQVSNASRSFNTLSSNQQAILPEDMQHLIEPAYILFKK